MTDADGGTGPVRCNMPDPVPVRLLARFAMDHEELIVPLQ